MLEEFMKTQSRRANSEIKNFLPKNISKEWINTYTRNIVPDFYENNFIDLHRPIHDIIDRGGKRWRPTFMVLCCDILGGGSKILDMIPVIEFLHSGSLIIDDIQDKSKIRRGEESIHLRYGNATAINTGNMMYYMPYLILNNIELPQRMKLSIHEAISEEMYRMHLGQGIDLNSQEKIRELTQDEYLQLCSLKTASLSRLSARIGSIFGSGTKKQKDSMIEFAESIGIAFQIYDDINNLTKKSLKDKYGEDITTSKATLPIIKTLEIANKNDQKRLLDILDIHTTDTKLISEAIKIIEKYNSIEYSEKIAKDIVKKSWGRVNKLIPESTSKNKLKLFADYIINNDFK